MGYLEQIEFWHWWVLCVALITIEVIAPSTILLWPGVGALLTGLALLIFGSAMGWELQFVAFAVLSIASVVAWRAYRHAKGPEASDEPMLNRRGEQYVGRVFTLAEPIIDGAGTLRVDDTLWKIAGHDVDAGARVRVTGVNGMVLQVESA
jgi:membrane protein implicated in regulation of membrane protease activity